MNEHKQTKFIIDVSASAKRPNRSTTRFFSYDSHTAEIVIQAEKDGKLIDQTLVDTVEIYFESVNMKYRPIDGLKWNDTMEIGTDGLYSYILPDDFLNYEGLVAFDVYINYKNGDRADSSNRIIFEQRISAIDRAAGAVELVYIKDMETAKREITEQATEITENFLREWNAFEAGSTAKMQELEQRIDGQTEIFNNADVYNKAEIEDKLEPFALRTDIADVSAQLADIEQFVKVKTVEQVIEKMINKQPVVIVARGDSITYGYVPNSGAQTTNPYPKTLQTLLRDYYGYDGITVVNMGNSGKQSDEFASDTYVNEVIAQNPDMIIFMCGINDARGGTSGGAVVPVQDYKNNIALMVSKLDYPFIFMTPTFFQDTEDKKNRFAQYVQAMREMAKTLNVKLIDLHGIVLKDLTMREVAFEDVAPDNIHFIDSYYQKIAEFVFAHGLCNVDIRVNENTFIDPLSVMWRWKGRANLFSSALNPLKKNIFLTNASTTIDKITLYLYVDRTDLALQPLYVPNDQSSPNNTIEVNGISYPQPYTTPSQTIWKLREGLFDLKYGLNKIVFNTDGSVSGKIFNLIYGANIIKREKNVFGKNIVFSGAYNIGADVAGTQKTRKLVSFKHNNFTKLTIKFTPNGRDSGIGFGTGIVLHNGNIVEYPLSTVLFNGTTANLYDLKKNYNSTMFSESGALGFGTLISGTLVFNLGVENTLEVTLNANNYAFKLNGVDLFTLSKTTYNLGVMDVWGYSISTATCVVNEVSVSS